VDINALVSTICPNFPQDRQIIPTMDREAWYKINKVKRTMHVPYDNVLRYSDKEIDRFCEAVHNFEKWEDWSSEDSWNNLVLQHTDSEARSTWLLGCLHGEKEIAVDIESRHLGFENNKILSISFSHREDEAFTITMFNEKVLYSLQCLFNRTDIKFIWQNGKFDCVRLKYLLDIDARIDEDTMLMHYVGINERRGTHGLKDMAQLYLQSPAWEDELDQYKKKWCREHKILLENFTFDLIPIEILIPYNQRDAIATLRLYHLYQKLMRPESEFIYRKLIEASNVFKIVELNGIAVDINYLHQLAEQLCEELTPVQTKCNELIAHLWNPSEYQLKSGAKSEPAEFNLRSPKQLKWIIEKAIGHSIKDTNEETLNELFKEESNEFITVLKELRKLNKKIDTYVTGIDKGICRDGRIRGTYNLHGTETGRLSCTNPNMQNIPRESQIKNLFRASNGYKLVQLDYSQAELRVLATLSNDPAMRKVYNEGGDLHSTTASKIFGENFTKEQRAIAKTINFGISYGLSATELSRGLDIPLQDAAKFIQEWYRAMPVAKRFIQMKRAEPLQGKDCTTPFGRDRHFIITDQNLYHIQNEAINTPIQSMASDLTLFSLLQIHYMIQQENFDARIVATVHDSILLEVKDNENLDRVACWAKQLMEYTPIAYWKDENLVPFVADIEIGTSWGDLKKYE
jgi:DNA polymerase-1